MIKKLFTLLLVVVPFLLSAQAYKKTPLDGKAFVLETLEDGKKKPLDPDDVKFNQGKFKSYVFSDPQWGFTKGGKYEITSTDSTTKAGVIIYTFTVDLLNDGDDKLAWSGTIEGDAIEGTIELINKKGVAKRTYTFTGDLKKKPGKK